MDSQTMAPGNISSINRFWASFTPHQQAVHKAAPQKVTWIPTGANKNTNKPEKYQQQMKIQSLP